MGNRTYPASKTKPLSAFQSKDAPFIPILPFSAPSDLGALYILGPELGRGQFGIIRSCTSRFSGTHFACKSISKLTCSAEDVVREVCIMRSLSNELRSQMRYCTSSHSYPRMSSAHVPSSIVQLHDVVEDEASVHLILELCCGGELFDRIRKKKCYTESQAAFLIKSLLEAVQFCHNMGIVHRDIKPENILLVNKSETSPIKLIDFGLALEFTPSQKLSGMAGSSYYIAPEVLQEGTYSKEVDMWSTGVVLYILLSGAPPFCGATEQRIFNAIRKGELRFPSSPWDKISAAAKDMITQMLHPDAKSRLTPTQALEHPWIVHHTRNAQHIQPNCISIRPSSPMSPRQHGSTEKSRSRRSSSLSTTPYGPTSARAGVRVDAAKQMGLSKVLGDLVAGMNGDTFSVSEAVARRKWGKGWACSVKSVNADKETVVVRMGQENYLVDHDRTRKRICWRLLKDSESVSP